MQLMSSVSLLEQEPEEMCQGQGGRCGGVMCTVVICEGVMCESLRYEGVMCGGVMWGGVMWEGVRCCAELPVSLPVQGLEVMVGVV